jgi:hypothetical protein
MLQNEFAGRRLIEWWLYERQTQQPAHRAAALYAMGELAGAELDAVMRDWRQHYEHALGCDNFSDNGGADGWLQGAAARRAYYGWAGIPRDVVRQWDAVRRRQAKVIRDLKRVPA